MIEFFIPEYNEISKPFPTHIAKKLLLMESNSHEKKQIAFIKYDSS